MSRPYTPEHAKIMINILFQEKDMTRQIKAEILLDIIHDIGALAFQNVLEEIKRR